MRAPSFCKKALHNVLVIFDVVYCYGYGFPRFKGGPMHAIESMGLDKAVTLINEFRDQLNPEHWQVAPLLTNLVANGGQLADYHRD